MNNVRAIALATMVAILGVAPIMLAPTAAAHIRVDDSQRPPKGGYGIVTLIVPTESQKSPTVGVTVTLPDDVNLTSARTLPIAGWEAGVETEPVDGGTRISRIVWRANDGSPGLRPSEFGEFTFSAGPWPDTADTVALTADQTYGDGSVVTWNEVAVDDVTEPEHPAPVVTLGAPDAHHGGGPGAAHGASPDPTRDQHAHPTATAATGETWFWRVTSLTGLVIAAGTAVALVVVLRRTRATES